MADKAYTVWCPVMRKDSHGEYTALVPVGALHARTATQALELAKRTGRRMGWVAPAVAPLQLESPADRKQRYLSVAAAH